MPSLATSKGSELPWWVNAIYKVGVPTAIACYLVWVLVTKIQVNIEATQNQLNNVQLLIANHINQENENIQVHKLMLDAVRRICINTSESKVERDECVK